MPRILLAEDDEIMRISISDRLKKYGWQVDEAKDGRQAMGLVIFTGLSLGTLFTLFVVPAFYLLLGSRSPAHD